MSHGFQIFNPDGTLALDGKSRPPRLIFHERFPFDFVGQRSVPDFDDTRGFISVSFGWHKHLGYPTFANADDDAVLGSNGFIALDRVSLPSVDWDNTTKILDIAAEGSNDQTIRGEPKFSIFMVMYG